MSVFDNDLSAKTDDQLEALERYYMTIQGQRALTNVESERLNAVLYEQHMRNVTWGKWDIIGDRT